MHNPPANLELERLRAHVAALEQLLDVHERAVMEKSAELEYALQELREQTRRLAQSNADLAQFAYVASHDLQEPLRMVANFCQLLGDRLRDQLDEESQKFLRYAIDGAVRMQELISDLLAYSRLGQKGNPFRMVSCSAVVGQAIANLRGSIQERGARVTHDAALPTVTGDPTQLLQVFQNLISNAIKFCEKAPPVVHVSAQPKDGGEWVFTVRDNGIGIAPEQLERIFVIFQRLHLRSKYPGTGIGLALCKKIVERHGGRIWVDSQVGSGSVFYFSIPMETGESPGQ